jgi:hypothetical protein
MKRHESVICLSQLESLNGSLQLLEMPSIVINIYKAIEQLHEKQDAINECIAKTNSASDNGDRYMTPQEAMNYLGFSKNTFDKYRYSSIVKIKGYQLDGKTWYKKSDLDRFMLTYRAKSCGKA